uniref:Carbohydrate sulfotransferase n=1 Tax=Labrus bergylta TaxID=56723 RepID=A0A3Q3FV72_9LABR
MRECLRGGNTPILSLSLSPLVLSPSLFHPQLTSPPPPPLSPSLPGTLSSSVLTHNCQEKCVTATKQHFLKESTVFEDLRDAELQQLVVDDNHGIIYCYIPKVGENKSEPYQDPSSTSGVLVHESNTFTQLTSFPRTEMKAKLKRYTKFLFVRDPFVRLISAYRDKFQGHNQYFYHSFAQYILRVYGSNSNPPQTVDEAVASGTRPSFYNFIQYLNTLYILFIESLQEDNMTSDRRKLYKLYEADFRLFGYSKLDD